MLVFFFFLVCDLARVCGTSDDGRMSGQQRLEVWRGRDLTIKLMQAHGAFEAGALCHFASQKDCM